MVNTIMEKNVGGYDRIGRLVLGPVLILVGAASLLGLSLPATTTLAMALAVIAVLVGLVFVVTGAIQKCPINNLLGLNTFRGGTGTEETTTDASDGPGQTS